MSTNNHQPTPLEVAKVLRELKHQQAEVDILILRIPTGPVRNEITEVNIHLMEAIDKLMKALTLMTTPR